MFKFNLVGGSSRGMLAGVLILEVALLAFLNRNSSQNQLSSKSVTPDLDKTKRMEGSSAVFFRILEMAADFIVDDSIIFFTDAYYFASVCRK